MRFRDRQDAGEQLAERLLGYRESRPVVLALPRGGVPIAVAVAAALAAAIDLVMVRKIGVPQQPELAAGAVVWDDEEPLVVRNEGIIRMARVTEADFNRVKEAELAEIGRRRSRYLGDRASVPLKGRTAIVVDDGIATGATMRAALLAVRRRQPALLVVATPVAAPEALEALQPIADAIECLEVPAVLGAIGNFYSNFSQVSDEEVVAALAGAGGR